MATLGAAASPPGTTPSKAGTSPLPGLLAMTSPTGSDTSLRAVSPIGLSTPRAPSPITRSLSSKSIRRKQRGPSLWGKARLGVQVAAVFNDVQAERQKTLEKFEQLQNQSADKRHLLERARELKSFLGRCQGVQQRLDDKEQLLRASEIDPSQDVALALQKHQVYTLCMTLASLLAELKTFREDLEQLEAETQEQVAAQHPGANRFQAATTKLADSLATVEQLADEHGRALQNSTTQFEQWEALQKRQQTFDKWCEATRASILAHEPAEDLASARTQREAHEHARTEALAGRANLDKIMAEGQQLIADDHYAADQIAAALDHTATLYAALEKLAEERSVFYEQNCLLQEFLKTADRIDEWLIRHDQQLTEASRGETVEQTQELLNAHGEFEADLRAQQQRLEELGQSVEQARNEQHFDIDNMQAILMDITTKKDHLVAAAAAYRANVVESGQYFELQEQIEETMDFITEQMKQAAAETYRDLPLVEAHQLQHRANGVTIEGYREAVAQHSERADSLIANGHFRGEDLRELSARLQEHWAELLKAHECKGRRLQEAEHLVSFNRDFTDLETWLDSLERYVALPDLGHDVPSAEELVKEHEEHESELASRSGAMQALRQQAVKFGEEEHFAAEDCHQRTKLLEERMEDMLDPFVARGENLSASLELQQFLLAVRRQEAWIQLKAPLVHSEDYSQTLLTAKSQLHRFNGLEAELQTHEKSIQDIQARGTKLAEEGHYAVAQIQERQTGLLKQWDQLLLDAKFRHQKLGENLELQQFLVDLRQTEASLQGVAEQLALPAVAQTVKEAKLLQARHTETARQLESLEAPLQHSRQWHEQLAAKSSLGCETTAKLVASAQHQFDRLRQQANARSAEISDAMKALLFEEEAEEVLDWIQGGMEEAGSTELGEDVDACEQLRKEFADFAQEQLKGGSRVERIDRKANKLAGNASYSSVSELNTRVQGGWAKLQDLIAKRLKMLENAAAMLTFHRDADDTMDWIAGKERELDAGDLGVNTGSVAVLQRKHEALERDLQVLGKKLEHLFGEAGRLVALHPSHSQAITKKQADMARRWEVMQATAEQRRRALELMHEFFSFKENAQELLAWFERMQNNIAHVQPIIDLADAERRLQAHVELRLTIEAQQDTVNRILDKGEELLGIEATRDENIRALLTEIGDAQESLSVTWDHFNELYQEGVFIQESVREATELEAWMDEQQAMLAMDAGHSEHEWKVFEEFQQRMEAQEASVQRWTSVIDEIADELQSGEVQGLYRQHGSDSLRRGSVFTAAKKRPTMDSMTRRRPSMMTSRHGSVDFSTMREDARQQLPNGSNKDGKMASPTRPADSLPRSSIVAAGPRSLGGQSSLSSTVLAAGPADPPSAPTQVPNLESTSKPESATMHGAQVPSTAPLTGMIEEQEEEENVGAHDEADALSAAPPPLPEKSPASSRSASPLPKNVRDEYIMVDTDGPANTDALEEPASDPALEAVLESIPDAAPHAASKPNVSVSGFAPAPAPASGTSAATRTLPAVRRGSGSESPRTGRALPQPPGQGQRSSSASPQTMTVNALAAPPVSLARDASSPLSSGHGAEGHESFGEGDMTDTKFLGAGSQSLPTQHPTATVASPASVPPPAVPAPQNEEDDDDDDWDDLI
ncbi:uncharacterized protein MONBRDRAFT_32268 [Monosiga brevicollis MX1]|uniref:PH domain-containing protein n=1 Tax=Monosiga brevicollis TaxID=81824 RepID=A9UYG1_MONBE|nr:uncharacterized protein MONBRDRAFT_32268 [Monosiga brevicollis MX1]EDQ89455.1 predicted protein [Monosiga brevicollis MX1]|eukprot:XP_001745484.1 hypothetical protein [Monosiga brevicollis MX1]